MIPLLAVLVAAGFTYAQGIPPAPSFFGTWVWNPASQVDSQLDRYTCYIERLEDLGDGRVRMREHRIRGTQVIKDDVLVGFNITMKRPDGRTTTWVVRDAQSYQMTSQEADGAPAAFVVTRTISADGRRMTHIGEGVLNGLQVRNEQYFDRADGTNQSGDCAIE